MTGQASTRAKVGPAMTPAVVSRLRTWLSWATIPPLVEQDRFVYERSWGCRLDPCRSTGVSSAAVPYIPPYPPRPPVVDPPLRLLRNARENLLAIWPETTFSKEFFGHVILRRALFICNSPDTVKQVFVDDAENFERKSPQQRHALRPLIGDGLFISDGAVWRERH
jgi:hypothetical protein